MSEPVERSARGVSAAEKYAEVGDGRPRCSCHDRLMLWEINARKRAGGRWRCAVARYETTKRQRNTDGTWAFKEVRGLGVQGARRANYQRKYRRTQQDARDDLMIAQLETKLKGAA